MDGDEDYVPDTRHLRKYQQCAAVQALRKRQEAMPRWENYRDSEMRRRVQSESPNVRIAAIAWLIISSKTMRRRDQDYGLSDTVTWDIWTSIVDWFNRLDVNDSLPAVSTSDMKVFEAAMVANGHTCYELGFSFEKPLLARWLYIQNVLFEGSIGRAVNLMVNYYKANCKPCFD